MTKKFKSILISIILLTMHKACATALMLISPLSGEAMENIRIPREQAERLVNPDIAHPARAALFNSIVNPSISYSRTQYNLFPTARTEHTGDQVSIECVRMQYEPFPTRYASAGGPPPWPPRYPVPDLELTPRRDEFRRDILPRILPRLSWELPSIHMNIDLEIAELKSIQESTYLEVEREIEGIMLRINSALAARARELNQTIPRAIMDRVQEVDEGSTQEAGCAIL